MAFGKLQRFVTLPKGWWYYRSGRPPTRDIFEI